LISVDGKPTFGSDYGNFCSQPITKFVKPATVAGMKASLAANGRSVLQMVQQGINRPGAMERAINGLTTKVLNERLRNSLITEFCNDMARDSPRVEYKLTAFGEKFVHILNEIENSTKKSSTV